MDPLSAILSIIFLVFGVGVFFLCYSIYQMATSTNKELI